MQWRFGILVWLTTAHAVAVAAESSFPYVAIISVEEVEARSGPGENYYATQRLKRGEKVDVYRHDPGGWLAIRPPQRSFSWLAARHLNVAATSSEGEVAVDGAVAWVGSAVADVAQHKWQVRLERGEAVEVLGSKPLSVGPGFATETYHQIAPPAGEFRWIRAVSADASNLTPAATGRPTTGFIELQTIPPAGNVPSGARSSPAEPSERASRIERLNLDLSLLVTRPIEQWNFEPLRRRVAELAEAGAGTPSEKDARAVGQRIAEFERLQQRHEKLASGQADDADEEQIKLQQVAANPVANVEHVGQAGNASTAANLPATGGPEQPADATFDASGWLMPVHSLKRVAPPFALLDDEGRVQCYVTPAPGLNLHRYERTNVGVLGQRRYVDGLRAYHVTAERVVKQKTKR